MDIFGGGQISYVLADQEVLPRKGDILLIPPGVLHTGRLVEPCTFDRSVFHFDARAFQFLGGAGLPPLYSQDSPSYLTMPDAVRPDFAYLLNQVEYTVRLSDPSAALRAFSYMLQLFLLIGTQARPDHGHFSALPANVVELKSYIDRNYRTISSIADLSTHFFYSREHISRLFKYYYNTSISEYLMRKRIDAAKTLLDAGQSVTQAFSASGYRSMSAFIEAFRAVTSLSPSAYKKENFSRER